MNKECGGCRLNNLEKCLLMIYDSNENKCPCMTCIVKMICRERCVKRQKAFRDVPLEILKSLYDRRQFLLFGE